MITKIALSILMLFLSSCGGNSPKRSSLPPDSNPSSDDGSETMPGAGDETGTEVVSIGFVASAGSALRMVNGKSLTEIYKRIFTKNGEYWSHCNMKGQDRNMPLSFCMDSIFTGDERNFVGIFDMRGNAKSNVDRVDNINLNYLRSIRSALGRECKSLVEREWSNLKSNMVTENHLIKSENPTAANLEEFFRRILGIEGTGMKVDILADAYVNAFNKNLENEAQEEDKGRKALYETLCIALASDPQVILY